MKTSRNLDYALGIDLRTSAVKAGLLDLVRLELVKVFADSCRQAVQVG
jgi:sugar (pentulose or hexulose) kinase